MLRRSNADPDHQHAPGEAPEWVREAWVGLTLPATKEAPQKAVTSGVLSGPRNALERVVALLLGQLKVKTGYAVSAAEALAVLDEHRPEAANWWRTNAPNVLTPGRRLLFHGKCCELVPQKLN